jgi:vacuolar-type H+-ATPase subunit H
VTDAPATTAAPPPADSATVEALRRVKAVENEWELRLRAARGEAEEAVRRAREEAEATVKAVAAEAEAERARRLDAGRAAAEKEAEAIVSEGADAAARLRAEKGKGPTDRAAEVVAAALGPYAPD